MTDAEQQVVDLYDRERRDDALLELDQSGEEVIFHADRADLTTPDGRERARHEFYDAMEYLFMRKGEVEYFIGQLVYLYDEYGLWKDEWNTQQEWLENDSRLPYGVAWLKALKSNFITYHVDMGLSKDEIIQIGMTKLRVLRPYIDPLKPEQNKELLSIAETAPVREINDAVKDYDRKIGAGITKASNVDRVEELQAGYYMVSHVDKKEIDENNLFVAEKHGNEVTVYRSVDGTPYLKKGKF
jgi:hypothetical protein